MFLRQILDPFLAHHAYLVGCQRTGEALIIDPQRDINRYERLAAENGLRITAVAETHIHADFVSGAREFARIPDIDLYLSAEGGPDWNYQWPADRANTYLLKHGDGFSIGNIRMEAIHTPGHTPEHLCYLITDLGGGADQPIALATGDFLFVGDVGRPDLLESAAGMTGSMEPSARQLGESLRQHLSGLPDYLQILPAHGAGSACGKALGAIPTSTLGYERRFNRPLRLAESDSEAFIRDVLSGQPNPPPYFGRMKKVNRDGIVVTGGPPTPTRLRAGELADAASTKHAQLLDTREDRKAFDTAHAHAAIHAPLRSPFFSMTAGSYLDPESRIYLIVEQSTDADLAALQLYRIGFDHVAGWITLDDAKAAGLLTRHTTRIEFSDFRPQEGLREGEIIDVRTTAEFERGHLPGAKSFPYTRLKADLDSLPKNRRLFIHCGTGKRASLASSYLQSMGFDTVHVDGTCEECERIALSQGVPH